MPGKLIVDEIEDSGGTSVIGRKNYIINGNFDIWQRGTSVTTGYGPDRFTYQNSGSTGTLAQGSFTAGQTDVPNNPKYFANLTVTGADDNANIAHRIEDVYTLSGETATISFYAKHTTNAPTSFNVTSYQVFGSGGSTAVETSIATSQTTTTSWQKYTATVTFPSVSGKTIGASSYLELLFINPNNEIFDIQIAQIQLEKGSVATDFEVRPIGEELHLCKRYFQIISGASLHSCGIQKNITDNQYKVVSPVVLPVELRGLDGTVTIPSSTTNFSWQEAANSRTSIGDINTNNGQLLIYTSWTGTTLDAHAINVGGDIEIDAEL